MPVAYERHGSGPPLVLIHGLGHRRQGWNAVLDMLTPHHEVITLDLPGHGESPMLPPGDLPPVHAYVARLAQFIDDLKLERPHVAGNSLGGALALGLASRGYAASATGLSPAGFWNNRRQISYAHAMFATARLSATVMSPLVPRLSRSSAGRSALYSSMVHHPARVPADQARDDVLNFARTGEAMRLFFGSPESFSEPIGVPVTIAWGTRDHILMPANMKVARERLPNARFVWLPGCGHVPMTDDPPLVARVILEGTGAVEPSQASHNSGTAQPAA
jgi:pimeloyl-ACP methyl ester carboxylesterase